MASRCRTRWAEAIISEPRGAAARLPLSLALVLALAAGCAPKVHTSAVSAESHAPGTTQATLPAACSAYPAGAEGVVGVFCNGKARVSLTVNGVDHELKGGVCASGPAGFSLNLGVIAGPDLAGPKPDYVGLSTPVTTGDFYGAALTVVIHGKRYKVVHNNGALTPTGGSFQSAGDRGQPTIKGSFSC